MQKLSSNHPILLHPLSKIPLVRGGAFTSAASQKRNFRADLSKFLARRLTGSMPILQVQVENGKEQGMNVFLAKSLETTKETAAPEIALHPMTYSFPLPLSPVCPANSAGDR